MQSPVASSPRLPVQWLARTKLGKGIAQVWTISEHRRKQQKMQTPHRQASAQTHRMRWRNCMSIGDSCLLFCKISIYVIFFQINRVRLVLINSCHLKNSQIDTYMRYGNDYIKISLGSLSSVIKPKFNRNYEMREQLHLI